MTLQRSNHIIFFNILNRIFSYITYPIRRMPAFFCFLYLLGVLCIMTEVPLAGMPEFYGNSYCELFIDLYIISIPLCLIPAKYRHWITGLLYIVFYGVAIADIYCYLRFDTELSPTMLQIISETNTKETSEFLSSYITADILFSRLSWIFLLILLHLTFTFGKKTLQKQVDRITANLSVHLKRTCIHPAYANICIALITIVLIVTGIEPAYENKMRLHFITQQDTTYKLERAMSNHYADGLYLPIYRLWFAYYANNVSFRQIDKLNASVNNVKIDSCSFKSPNIILIIGESYNRHHSQLFGYDKKTTPRQVKRAMIGELIPFRDVITPWNITSNVFKNTFSMKGIEEEGEWSDYPLFPVIFRKAGYHVTFLTNQFVQNPNEQIFDFSGGSFLCNKDLSNAMFDCRNADSHPLDEGLLNDYDSLSKENGKYNLTIFHLIGQHATYEKRFPENQRHFSYTDYDRDDINKKWRGIVANYDNATLYNDSVVDAIIRRFENTDAIVIYMPDHGEECYDSNENRIFGRTHSLHPTPAEVRNEFEIPFWIWCSHSYRINHPEIYHQIVTSSRRPFMTDNLPHTLLYLAGIYCPYYKAESDLLSPKYNEKRVRLLKGTDDYDKLMTSKQAKDEQYYN